MAHATEHFTNTIATKQKEEVLNRKRRLSKVHTKFKQKSIFCADSAKLIQNIFVAFFSAQVLCSELLNEKKQDMEERET